MTVADPPVKVQRARACVERRRFDKFSELLEVQRCSDRPSFAAPEHNGMWHHAKSQTTIVAAPERVWAVLTDFESYPSWSTFVKSISGELREGARLAVRIESIPGGSGMAFKPVVTELREGAVLEWLGHLGIPGIFDGRHRFALTRLDDGTTSLTQSETFSGIAVPFLASAIRDTERGFAAFNTALKLRSEAA